MRKQAIRVKPGHAEACCADSDTGTSRVRGLKRPKEFLMRAGVADVFEIRKVAFKLGGRRNFTPSRPVPLTSQE